MHARRVLAAALALVVATVLPGMAQRQSAEIRGVVVESDDTPAGGVDIALADPLGATILETTSDSGGRFVFAQVAPGRFTIRALASPGKTTSIAVTVESALPLEVRLRLPPRVQEIVQVEGRLEAVSTRSSLGSESLAAVPARIRGRGLQDAVATLPGWATEDNGLLHARGVDDGFLYVVDGVPVYERLDALNGIAPDTPSLESITVLTGYVAPEFGYKAGGVIEVRSAPAAERWRGTVDAALGTLSTRQAGGSAGGPLGRGLGVRVNGSAVGSERFLDPVHPDNLHNSGRQGSVSGEIDAGRGGRDRGTVGWATGRARYDVPNTEEQELAAQDQRQRIWSDALTASWQRMWSDRTASQLSGYARRSGSALDGSDRDVPLFASADRSLRRAGLLASVSHQRGTHLVKAGIEAQALSIAEDFTFAVTDAEHGEEAGLSDGALEHGPQNPFVFDGSAHPSLVSMYLQDTWQANPRLTVAAGVRVDRSSLLLARRQWSPRAGVSFRVTDSTVARASINRYFQPPQPEYLLLSSSEQARELSPFVSDQAGGGADVEPERQWALEAGLEHRIGRWRIDAAWWRRDAREVADPNVFFGTTVIFPNAVAKGRAQGIDVRLEVPRGHGWSGYASGTFGKVVQTGPITGGLFLEDDIPDLGPGVEFVPDHDQRVAMAGGLTWEHARSGLTASVAARYESGSPIQRDPDDTGVVDRPGAELVDFDRGRVKPRFPFSVIAAFPLADADRARVLLRGSILNLFNEAYAFNFGNPFSGTHFGAPRTAAVSLELTFR